MSATRRTRQRLSCWMVGVLLAVQWLVAAYACPPAAAPHAPAAMAAAATPPCHEADDVSPAGGDGVLCKAHCEAGEQLPASADPGAAPATAWTTCFIVDTIPRQALQPARVAASWPREGARPPGWPPLHLTLQVLRN